MTETALQHEAEAPEEEIEAVDPPEPDAPEPKPEPTEAELNEAKARRKQNAQKRIDQITGAKYAAEQRAAAAEARADQLERANAELRKTYLTSADASLERDLKTAQARHQRAFSEGDGEAVTQAALDMAELAARRAEVQRDARYVPQPQQRQQAPQFTPKTQDYIDANPWFTGDPDAQATAYRAHEIAVRRGLKPDTPQYFDHITKVVKAAHPEHFEEPEEGEEEEAAPEPARRATAPPVAPARRTLPGQAPVKGTRPGLTPYETSLCKENNWDMKAYADNKARRMKDGTL